MGRFSTAILGSVLALLLCCSAAVVASAESTAVFVDPATTRSEPAEVQLIGDTDEANAPEDDEGSDDLPGDEPAQETALITDRPGPPIEVSWETEIVGGDYDSGSTNPALEDITYRECRVRCLLDDRCKAYTHDGQTNICTLKNSAGEKRLLSDAVSGIFVDREVVDQTRVVERSWPATDFDPDLTWRPDDTAETYIDRTRSAAERRGGTCEQDQETLKTLNIRTGVSGSGAVGQSLEFTWAGNRLRELMPVWLVLSTPSPVRFTGRGFFGLNPGAYGPFGIETARNESRAFVALYSHSAGESGSFGVVPLLAGDLQLKATVVAYLRACRQVVELSHEMFSLGVQPAAPRIVLHDPYALNIYRHQAEIASLGRRVLYNESRLLILESELGSEILERNGTDIRFSPTGRYVSVRSDNASDIIDVVDGAVVARIGDSMSGPDLLWFHNDSFVAVTRPPWGRGWLASTLNVGRPLYIFETSAACCDLDPSDGIMDVNLENNVIRIAGGVGGIAANLQDFELAVDYPGTSGFDDTFGPSSMIFLDAMGPVSALPNSFGFNQPIPPQPGAVVQSDAEVDAADADHGGPGETELGETRGAVSLIKPEDYIRSADVDLRPFGFEAALEIAGVKRLSPKDVPDWGGESAQQAEAARSAVRSAVAEELSKKDIRIDWMVPTGDFDSDLHCDYLRNDGSVKPSELPGALTIAQRIERPAGAIWILRSQCQGGATSATQAFKSALMIIDESRHAGRPARESIVEEHATDGTVFDYAFYDADFETKLIGDRQILFYMPGGGAIGLFDLETRSFTYKQQNLPRGDLLVDVHVRADGKFVLQVNSDKSFSLHRIADAVSSIEGRQVDGETVFWTSDFRFDSTAEGASFVQLRFPGLNGQYTFQQFDSRLRRTGLLGAALNEGLETSPVTIHVPPRVSGALSAAAGRIAGQATPTTTSTLKEIRLYQDGVLTDTFPATTSGRKVAIDARRLPGTRWVSLVAADVEGLVSLPIGRDFGADDTLTKTHLLAIGINSYEDSRLPGLSLAKADAQNLETGLKELDGKSIDMEDASTLVLTDAAASKSAILEAARRIAANTAPGDNAVIFFAGHGLQGADGRFYLGLSKTRVADVEGTALAWDEVAGILAAAKGRVTVLLDACHSGTAGTGLLASNDDAVDSIRSVIPSGLTVLAASKGRELSAELPSLGGGAFTHTLVQAIVGDRAVADANGNGRVEVSELYRYVKDKVSTLRDGQQTPWLSRNQMIGDFAIF